MAARKLMAFNWLKLGTCVQQVLVSSQAAAFVCGTGSDVKTQLQMRSGNEQAAEHQAF